VRTGFVSGKKLRLDIFLAASCITAACGDSSDCFGASAPDRSTSPQTLSPRRAEMHPRSTRAVPSDAGTNEDAPPTDLDAEARPR